MTSEKYSFHDRIIDRYVKNFGHRGQERVVSAMAFLLGRRRWVTKLDSGLLMSVDRGDMVQRYMMKFGHWDKEVHETLVTILRPDDIFYDVGANIGYFSILAASCGVEAVLAFEPFEDLANLVKENSEINGFDGRIRILPVAVGMKSGESKYIKGPTSNSGAGRIEYTDGGASNHIVHVISLDTVAEETGQFPTVIKIDVEGGEQNVLRGAKKLLSSRPPRAIIFEAKCTQDGDLDDIVLEKLLNEAGYQIQHLARLQREPLENFLAILK